MTSTAYPRLLPTADGGSRFDVAVVAFEWKNFAPPAQPFGVSPLGEADRCGFLQVPAGWQGEMHPSPLRMWIFLLQGRMRFQTSDGDERELGPGSALLLEDVVGCGHVSRVLSDDDAILAVVSLPGA